MSDWTRWAVLCVFGFVATATADDSPPAPPVASRQGAPFEPRWLDDLRSDDFQLREAATKQLFEAGESAVGPIRDAIPKMDHESATRAIEVLDKLSQSNEAEVKSAAGAALKALEESEIPAVASLARGVRVKHQPPPDPAEIPFGAGGLAMRGGMRFRAGGVVQIQVQTINGKRTARMKEPGKKVELTDENGKNIRMRVTETVDGKEKTTEYEANDAEELAKKHPDAAPLYERMTQQQGGLQFPVGPIQLRPRVPQNVQDPEKRKKIESAQDNVREQMRRATQAYLSGQDVKEAQKELEKAIQESNDLLKNP